MASIGSTRIDDTSSPGSGLVLVDSTTQDVGPDFEVVLSETVPSDASWRIQFAEVCCRGFGRWEMRIDGMKVAGGITDPLRDESRFKMPDFFSATSDQVIEVLYLYGHGPAGMPVDAYVGVVET